MNPLSILAKLLKMLTYVLRFFLFFYYGTLYFSLAQVQLTLINVVQSFLLCLP